jgi:hypothetical protein
LPVVGSTRTTSHIATDCGYGLANGKGLYLSTPLTTKP